MSNNPLLEREGVGTILLPGQGEEWVTDEDTIEDEDGFPPIFGRCPVCNSPLFPRDKITGEPKAPPVGTGFESRARCSSCGAIICYIGDGKWRVLTNHDLTPEDIEKDKAGE